MTDYTLRVENLRKTFGEGEGTTTAVDDLSFAVEPGELVGLLGPNGAGKTTTIKSILGLVLPDAGTIDIGGVDAREHPRRAHAKTAATMEGARNQYWRLTVRENLAYFAAVAGEDVDDVRERHDHLLEAFSLTEHADDQVRTLSRGMKQKASLASVLARDAEVVFLDEPTLGLDVGSAVELRSQLRAVAEERDLTVLLSSHDMDTVEAVCERAVIIEDGEVVVDDTIDSLLAGFGTRGYRVTVRGAEAESLAALDDVDAVEALDGDTLCLDATADSDAFYRLVGRLEEMDARIEGVETREPDLETAFVDATGGA